MGDNAQTSVPKFTSGDVLTAANTNLLSNGIPVFSGTATRNDAFGGTGEKVLAEGQFAFLEDSNSTQFYDGAAWQPVGTTPGLVCVKAETAFSAVATVTADSVFTSSYTNYLLVISFTANNAGEMFLQLRTGGVTATTDYNYQQMEALNTTVYAARGSASAMRAGDFGTAKNTYTVGLFGPQLAEQTNYISNAGGNEPTASAPISQQWTGNHTTATAYDGIIVSATASRTLTGTYAIYAYSKTV